MYPRALQQILTGVYLAEVCMMGLFAIKAAIGPLVLMGLFTLFTILAHISLNDALAPLLTALPRTLNTEDDWTAEFCLEKNDSGVGGPSTPTKYEKEFRPRRQSSLTLTEMTASHNTFRDKLRIVTDWLVRPSIYANCAALRSKVRQDTETIYDENTSESAYYPPPVSRPTPLLWIPRDAGGVSRVEVELTSKVIPITDDEAHLNDKNKVVWDKVKMKPPIWEEKVFY